MKKFMTTLAAAIAFAAQATPYDFSAWTNRMMVSFNYTGGAPLSNFPALVRIKPEVAARMKSDGSDLRFADLDGNLIPHEIDTWAPSTNSLVWVRVPELDNTAQIRAYFGNPNPPAPLPASAVWDANFMVVQHFSDANGWTIADSTAAGRTADLKAAANGNRVDAGAGGIGRAIDLTGGDGRGMTFGEAATSSTHLNPGNNWTASIWFKGVKANSLHRTLLRGSQNHHLLLQNNSTYDVGAWFNEPRHSFQSALLSGNQTRLPVDAGWRLITAVGTSPAGAGGANLGGGRETRYYLNGNFIGAGAFNPMDTIHHIGCLDAAQQFADYLDEVRVSSTNRSPAWVKAEYDTVALPNFAVCGLVEDLLANRADPLVSALPASGLHGLAGNAEGLLIHPGAGAAAADIHLFWGKVGEGSDALQWSGCDAQQNVPPGPFTFALPTLEYTNEYQYRFLASNTVTSAFAWSDVVTFAVPGKPSLDGVSHTLEIANTRANLRGGLLDIGGAPVDVDCFFGDNTGTWVSVKDWKSLDAPQELLHTQTGLLPATTYYYAFRAVNVMDNGQGPTFEVWTATNTLSFLSEKMWTGFGGDRDWDNPGNWSGGVPGAVDIALFQTYVPTGGALTLGGRRQVYKLKVAATTGFTLGVSGDTLAVTDIERTNDARGDLAFAAPLEVVRDANGRAAWALGTNGAMRINGGLRGGGAGCTVTRTGYGSTLHFSSRNDYNGGWILREGVNQANTVTESFMCSTVVKDGNGNDVRIGNTIIGGGDVPASLSADRKNAYHGNFTVIVGKNGTFSTVEDLDNGRIDTVHAMDGGIANINKWYFYSVRARLTGGTIQGGGSFFAGGWNNSIISYASDRPAFFNTTFGFTGQDPTWHGWVEVANGNAIIDLTVGGVLNGGHSGATFSKSGAGIARLLSGNGLTYSKFDVTGGTLLCDNKTGSASGRCPFNISAGATLGGTGFIGGRVNDASNVTLNNGASAASYATLAPGTIDPGDGSHVIGTLTVGSTNQNNNVTLGNFSRFRATLGPAMANDRLDVFGAVTFNNDTTLEITTTPQTKSGVYTLIYAKNGLLGQQRFANVLVNGVKDDRYVRYVPAEAPVEVQYLVPSSGAIFMLR